MSNNTIVGICGYGNLARGVENELRKSNDIELASIFTRRNPSTIVTASGVPVYHVDNIRDFIKEIDVMIMCGGSRDDLPIQVPKVAGLYNTVDSYDTHNKMWEYTNAVDEKAKAGKKISIIGAGWDPGFYTSMRVYGDAIIPDGTTNTLYGNEEKGLSQGHSAAIRNIAGVKNAVQYTIAKKDAIRRVKSGERIVLNSFEKHLRRCVVVPEDGADIVAIEKAIRTMPDYFAGEDVEVNFVTEEEFDREHSEMKHGGYMRREGITGEGNHQVMEVYLTLDSNPEYTASTIIAAARAAHKMYQAGMYGAKIYGLDVPPAMLSRWSREELIKKFV